MTIPISITATTPLEVAALQAVFLSAEGDWFGRFPSYVVHYYYEHLGLLNDDGGAQVDLSKLSDLMVKWSKELDAMVEFSKKVEY